jgi:hypothetical protein
MKNAILALLVLLSMATSAAASDSIAAGIRIGTVSNKNSGQYYEAFGDLYLNNLISIGATASYYLVDHNSIGSVKRDEAMPITALFKVHAPIPFIKPYAGLGQAIVFHNKYSATGSPVAIFGVSISPLPLPLFLNVEYRHQFNGELDFLTGGVGVKF